MNILWKKKIQNYVLCLLKNISGFYIFELINYVNLSLTTRNFKDKGLLGRLIENYIIKKNIKGNVCDIKYLNWECKTISLNNIFIPINEVLLLTFKFFNFFTLNFKKKFFFKIHKILWIPILGNKNVFFLYKKIGNSFLTILNQKNIFILWKELKKIINFILNKNLILPNFYSKHFRLQFLLIKKENYLNLNNYYIRIYLNKFFIKNIFLNFKKYI